MADEPREPIIRGRLMALRPVWPTDFELFYSWFADADEAPLWTSQFRRLGTFPEFVPALEAWLRDGLTLVKVDEKSGTRFGFARAYQMNLVDGYAWVQAFTTPAYRLRRHSAESAILFSKYLFERFPLRKLCSEVYEYNSNAVSLNEKLGFVLEGRLRAHTWFRDRYWDHLLYSLNRDDWAAAVQRFGFITGIEEELARVSNASPSAP